MNKEPFPNVNRSDDPHWIVKVYFNEICNYHDFLHVVELMADRVGISLNYKSCFFSDPAGADPDGYFIGVQFCSQRDVVIITEREYENYLFVACESYAAENEENREKIAVILRPRQTK